MVETGAAFSQFADPLLGQRRIAPDGQVPGVLADGTPREQPAAWVEVRYGDRTAFTLVLVAGREWSDASLRHSGPPRAEWSGDQDDGARGAAGLEVAVGFRGRHQRVALADDRPQDAARDRPEHAA
jgi:hypothetical protein